MARFHICLAVTDSVCQHNGVAPVARSPEAAHRGTTWDYRAADLCMNHVLTLPRQTGADVNRGDIWMGKHPLFFFLGMSGEWRRQAWVDALTKKLHILMLDSHPLPVCLSHLSCEMREVGKTEGTTSH